MRFSTDGMELNPVKAWNKFYDDSRHVLSISYKPNMELFRKTLKIVALGTLIIGILGFVISILIGFILSL